MTLPLRASWPVLAWAAAIALLTTVPIPAPGSVRTAPHVDKLAHLGLYLGLGTSLGRALWLSGRVGVGWVASALAVGLAFGAFNEWVQGFVPTRVPSAADWLADVAGVSLGIALYLWPRVRAAVRTGVTGGGWAPVAREREGAG